MIKTSDLIYRYGSGLELRFPELEVDSGDTCLVIGQSGVGKTTFLHLMAGLMRPKSGHIFIGDEDITKMNERALDDFRGKKIGIIFQKNHFVQSLSVFENLVLSQKLAGTTVDKAYCKKILAQLNIEQYSNRKTQELSEGEKQRFSIARALVNKPILILADEPSSALDDENCKAVTDLLKQQADEIDASLVIVTHDNRLKELIENRIILSKENVHA